jgi:hypothetical protein
MLHFKEYLSIQESADTGLAAKAKKSGISIGTLRKVYRRGVAAWNSGHRPGTTPQQWGMARVNSYITKGKGTYHGADKDLREEEILEGDTSNLPRVSKDKESGLPKKYVAGLSASTAKARAAHWKEKDKLSDSDPRAYEPAPGDANAKTKESKHTKKYRELFGEEFDEELFEACWVGYKQVGIKKKGDKMVPNCVKEDSELDEAAVDAKGHKSSTGGLTQKGRDYYNNKYGSNLKAPVTTKPSKLKPGSKAANRRKSFCARMSGVDGPMKDEKGRPTRKALALRKWNC